MTRKINGMKQAERMNETISIRNKSDYLVAYLAFEAWEAAHAKRLVAADGKTLMSFKDFAPLVNLDRASDVDKAAARGLLIDYDAKARKASPAGDFDKFSPAALYTLTYKAGARKAYDAGGINAARRACVDFMSKHNIANGAKRDDIAAAGAPVKHDNTKARNEIKEADAKEAARLAEKAAQADKEARAKAAAALKARKADFDLVMEILRADYQGNKRDFDKLIRAARAAAFAGDDYEASEYIAARKKEADKEAAARDAEKAAKKAAEADKRAGKCAGASKVTITTPADKEAAANAGGHSIPHKVTENDGAGAKAYAAALKADKEAAAK